MNYKEELDRLFNEARQGECPPDTKLEFLGAHIFDFTTYDNEVDAIFATGMLEVIEAILNKTTHKYIRDMVEHRTNYLNYLMMVNMSFLSDKLNWGSSIRGAWFDEYGHHSEKPEDKVYHITHEWSIPKKEINEFMRQLLEWSKS